VHDRWVSDFVPLPAGMAERAAAFHGRPAPARRAATVVLLRATPPAFQVYLLRRRAVLTFGGVYAFPGGSVDPGDGPAALGADGATPLGLRADWAARLALPAPEAAAVVTAAVRELYEETGVLLAGAAEPPTHGDRAAATEDDRLALVERRATLAGVLGARGLRIRDDLLVPWARWVTPEFEPRRFDTYFFVAALPDGQDPRDLSGEADRTAWVTAAEAERLPMLPPTRVTVRELAAYPGIDAVLGADRDAARPVEPRLARGPDGALGLLVSRSGR
jgi:8-oxo-dGTP pyrophosphatase MutT (NUDIX family)